MSKLTDYVTASLEGDDASLLEIALESHPRYNKRSTYRDYFDGEHAVQLTKRQMAYLNIKNDQEFNVNYCPIVVDALGERVNVSAILVSMGEEGEEQERELSKMLWSWWSQNRLDAIQTVAHASAIRDGDAYLMVGWDKQNARPHITFEMAFDGTSGVEVFYGSQAHGHPAFAMKRWISDDGDRINLYFEDSIAKYIRPKDRKPEGDARVSGWVRYMTEGTNVWPMPWVDANKQPLGIPVFHLKNNDQGYAYGISELKDVTPIQNALNKSVIDLLAAADTTAFRIYYMIGDNPNNMNVVPGTWVYSEKEEAQIGHIPGEDLSKLIEFKDTFAAEIARVSRTPLSFFQITGQVKAEGTLKQEEAGLVARAKKRQVSFGNVWEDVMNMGIRLESVFSDQSNLSLIQQLFKLIKGDSSVEIPQVTIIWSDPEIRNDKSHLETLVSKHELGVPVEQLWSEMGYSSLDIESFKNKPAYKLDMLTKAFEAVVAGEAAGIPAETVLREAGINEELIAQLGTARLAAITLKQEDVVPSEVQ